MHRGTWLSFVRPTGFRYLFVIYGFSVAETEKVEVAFLLGRAPDTRPFGTFLTLAVKNRAQSGP